MDYEKPVVLDFGSIVDHTFVTGGTPHKDTAVARGPGPDLQRSLQGNLEASRLVSFS